MVVEKTMIWRTITEATDAIRRSISTGTSREGLCGHDKDNVFSEFVSDRPEVREDWVEEAALQELDAERAAGAFLVADRALDELHVAVFPLLESLVEVGHQLEEDRERRNSLVEP